MLIQEISEMFLINLCFSRHDVSEKQMLFTDEELPCPDEFVYEYSNSIKIPLKNSVSKILKMKMMT